MSSIGKSLALLGIGAAAGAAAGLLLAPSSGKKLRKNLNAQSRQYLNEIEGTWNDGVDTVKKSARTAKESIDQAVDKLGKVVPN